MRKKYTTPKPSKCVSPIQSIITNKHWRETFNRFFKWQHPEQHKKEYYEAIGVMYSFDPQNDWQMSNNENIFSNKKASAIYDWYKDGSQKNRDIENYFEEYRGLIDDSHKEFNSNYGYYFYRQKQLNRCAKYLSENPMTRHACICINSHSAMSVQSKDKLCTNNIQFFIRRGSLKMIVQMRSSNFLTLLPYDIFMFSVLYWQMFHKLKEQYKLEIKVSSAVVFVNSLHFYQKHFDKLAETEFKENNFNIDMSYDKNNIKEFEEYLTKNR